MRENTNQNNSEYGHFHAMNSLSRHTNNQKKDILVLDEGPINGLDDPKYER